MRSIFIMFVCIITCGAVSAQKKTGKTADEDKVLVTGLVTTKYNVAIPEVRAFVYKLDSTIAASGYSDEKGKYSTNILAPGNYYMKFIYPNDNSIIVGGISVTGRGNTIFNMKMNPPANDTAYKYEDLFPKAPKAGDKKGGGSKKTGTSGSKYRVSIH